MSRVRPLLSHPALALGLATLALHLWVNGGYGYFRDELYYIVCGRDLAWGYVDQPPLTPLLAWASDAAFPFLRGFRLVPTLAAAATVARATEAARLMGGGLAGLAVLAGGALQLFGVLLITDTLQPPAWLAIAMCIIKAEQSPRWLLAAGAIAGLAFLAKYTVVFYLASVALGLLATPQRRLLARWQPWGGDPDRARHRGPEPRLAGRERMAVPGAWAELAAHKNIPLSPVAFIGQEMLTFGPASAPIWVAGLVAFAFWPRFAHLRWVAISWASLIAATIAAHGKPYYPAGAYPLLMAGGAVALEAWLPRFGQAALAAFVLAGAALTAPLVMPVLPIETFIAYQRWLGLQPSTGERIKLGVLPQYFADMFGWPELAGAVGAAYQALPPQDRERAVFFGRNYGEAAAVDVFGEPFRLPPAISAHESYFLWGPRGHDGSVMLILGGTRDGLLKRFRSVEPVGRLDNPLGMPEESANTLWLCRDSLEPLEQAWPSLRHFD